MIVEFEFPDDQYDPIWNLMHERWEPCPIKVAKLGKAWENAKENFYDYARNMHDSSSVVSAMAYELLMTKMDNARKELLPHMDQWYRSRHGIGLN